MTPSVRPDTGTVTGSGGPAPSSHHRDPVYMPADPKTWSAFNATLDGDHCEATMSYGVMRDVEVYKSWTVNRRRQPQDLITKFDYLHPLLTPDSMLAQRDLRAYQGQEGLWFAGSHVFDVDSQESAVYSAIQVAKALAPNSANLTRLGPLPASPAEP